MASIVSLTPLLFRSPPHSRAGLRQHCFKQWNCPSFCGWNCISCATSLRMRRSSGHGKRRPSDPSAPIAISTSSFAERPRSDAAFAAKSLAINRSSSSEAAASSFRVAV